MGLKMGTEFSQAIFLMQFEDEIQLDCSYHLAK